MKRILSLFLITTIIISTLFVMQCTATSGLETPKIASISNTTTGIKVTWNSVNGATNGYRVYRRGAGQSWTYLTTVKSTNYSDNTVKNNNYYRYTVRATNGKTYSDYDANAMYIKYVATPKMTSISNEIEGINIKWSSVSGATNYRIYRRGAGEQWRYLCSTTKTSYLDTSISKSYNKYYRYTVRAVNGYYSSYESGLYIKRVPKYVIPVSQEDIHTMAKLVYLEARGESYRGQVAVAEVVINRVLSRNFPNTVNGVVYQSGQFTPAYRISSTTATQTQYNAVYDALTGNGVLNNRRVVYFAVGGCCGSYYTTIGNHVFGCE